MSGVQHYYADSGKLNGAFIVSLPHGNLNHVIENGWRTGKEAVTDEGTIRSLNTVLKRAGVPYLKEISGNQYLNESAWSMNVWYH